MSTPDQAGPTRPARLAGLALLAVAAIALVVGLISVFNSGGDEPPQGANTPGTSPSAEPPTSGPPASQPPPPPASSSVSETPPPPPPPPPSSSSTPPPTTSVLPPPSQANTPGHTQTVRVYNNSYIEGLAARAANDFRAAGWNVSTVSGYPGGVIYVPTVYYRPGTAEEEEARALGAEFNLRVEERFEGIKNASPGIIVIVTKDYNPKSK
jgi:type IV secretory pathway VirB10-like protein